MPFAPCNDWLRPQKKRRRPEPLPRQSRAANPPRDLGRRLVAFRRSEEQQEARLCPVCDNPFQAPKTVRTVYCSMACRQEAERVRDQALNEERDRRLAQTAPPTLPARIELSSPPPPARVSTRQSAPARDPLEPTATRNCQQPITIVALLATPEAARPTMPRHRTKVVPLRRTP